MYLTHLDIPSGMVSLNQSQNDSAVGCGRMMHIGALPGTLASEVSEDRPWFVEADREVQPDSQNQTSLSLHLSACSKLVDLVEYRIQTCLPCCTPLPPSPSLFLPLSLSLGLYLSLVE